MAESDTTGLAALIKQRTSRPSYARMISWEILKSSGSAPPQKSRKSEGRRKKKPASTEQQEEEQTHKVTDDSDSGESEYFSADENFPEETSCTSSESIEDENITSSSGSDDDNEVLSPSFQAMHLCNTTGGERRRRPSKKQKRKRRQQGQSSIVCFAEYTIPFRHAESMDIDLCEDLLPEASNVSARVPSLFELCTKSLWSKSGTLRTAQLHLLPSRLKSSVTSYRQSQAFSSLQLSCLYRSLAKLESDSYIEYLTGKRNVWVEGWAVNNNFMSSEIYGPAANEIGNGGTFIIPITYGSYAPCRFGNIIGQSKYSDVLKTIYLISVVASVLDLMVPVHLRPARRKDKLDCTLDKEDQALVSCVNAVLTQLKQRYKSVVDECSEQSLPYLYWVRGHTKLALKQFLRLSDTATEVHKKVHYLMEAARLCQLQGNMESVRKLFRQSHEMALETSAGRTESRELKEQLLMLCANTYDQGVFSKEKALQSLKAWQYLAATTCTHAESYLAALEAVMCYHLSHLPGENVHEKLGCVLELAETASQHFWLSRLHLSLLHAWLGDVAKSVMAYRRMPAADATPGSEFKPGARLDLTFTPWQLLVTEVKRTVTPLHVVWRTQLGYFRVIKDLHMFEGDLTGKSLQLRLSPEGHLTGDLHLLLPPVRAFNLDLYTGKLILPQYPGQTHTQKTMFHRRETTQLNDQEETGTFEFPNGSYALVSMELYSDEKGRQVHLLTTGGCGVLGIQTHVSHLQLTMPNGHRTKLSLNAAIKRGVHKKLKHEIQKEFTTHPNNTTFMEEATKGLEYAENHDIYLANINDASNIGKLVDQMMEKKNKEGKKQTANKRVKSKYKRHSRYVQRFRSHPKKILENFRTIKLEIKDFVNYGHTLCLLGIWRNVRPFLLFVDISKRETFTVPEVFVYDVFYHGDQLEQVMLDVVGRCGSTVPRAEVLWIRGISSIVPSTSFQACWMFGQGGKRLPFPRIDLDSIKAQCVLGSSVFCIEHPRQMMQVIGAPQIISIDTTPTLTEVQFGEGDTEVNVHDLDPDLLAVKRVADRLLLVRKDGLRVLRPDTLLPEPLLCSPGSQYQCELSDDSQALLVQPVRVSVLDEKIVTSPTGASTVMVPVAVNDLLVMLGLQERHSALDPVVEIAFCVKVPGHVTEVCFMGQTAGYLISSTMHPKGSVSFYRETVSHLSSSGQLLAILPCLGPGPRDFCPLLLPPSQDGGTDSNPASSMAWHVYMRDGHEGIICVRL